MAQCRPCRRLVELAHRDSDTAAERRTKEIVLPVFSVATAVLAGAFAAATVNPDGRLRVHWWGNGIGLVAATTLVLRPLLTRTLPLRFVAAMCFAMTVNVCFVDWRNAAVPGTPRTWPLVILIMDIFLALNVERTAQWVVLLAATAWALLSCLEDGFRLGLYDIEGWSEVPDSTARRVADCAAPPCASGPAAAAWQATNFLFVFYIDYFATRSFAEGLRDERECMAAVVAVAEQVAGGLARFDLEAAEAALDGAHGPLPPALSGSLVRLIANLSSYRPYLPDSVFQRSEAGESQSSPTSVRTVPTEPVQQAVVRPTEEQARAVQFFLTTPPLPSCGDLSHSPSVRSHSKHSKSAGERATTVSSAGSDDAWPLPSSRHVPRHRNVVLLACNRCGFLHAMAQMGHVDLVLWLAAEVDRFCTTVRAQGGVVDLLSGDHLCATFGAYSEQGTRCQSATQAAWSLARSGDRRGEDAPEDQWELQSTAAVCSGRALCGDFGSAAAQRFMVLGGVSSLVVAAERAAAAWRSPVLVDSGVHADVEQRWSCRLRRWVIFPKAGSLSPRQFWDVVADRMAGAETGEWMYQLQSALPNPWEPYNDVVALWCGGGEVDLKLAAATAHCHGEVLDALRAVQRSVQAGVAPPVGSLCAGELFGSAAPLN